MSTPKLSKSTFPLLGLMILISAGLLGPGGSQAQASGKLVLVLGTAQSVIAPAIRAVGGVPVSGLGGRPFTDLSVIVLGNIAYQAIPGEVSAELRSFLSRGGSLLITGGRQSFGSGGYEVIQDLLPFAIWIPDDFIAKPFKPPIALTPNHPAIGGGRLATIGQFNDMNPKPGALEILQHPGGGGRVARFSAPLMAEQRVGGGLVLGIAFDVAEVVPASVDGGQEVMKNTIRYLLSESAIPAPRPGTTRLPGPPGSGQLRCVEMPNGKFACF